MQMSHPLHVVPLKSALEALLSPNACEFSQSEELDDSQLMDALFRVAGLLPMVCICSVTFQQ
jgi:hypothetical protein